MKKLHYQIYLNEIIPRIHEKILNNLDDYYAWGLNDKNLLINYLKKPTLNLMGTQSLIY